MLLAMRETIVGWQLIPQIANDLQEKTWEVKSSSSLVMWSQRQESVTSSFVLWI